MKIIQYKDGIQVKTKNKRVDVGLLLQGDYLILFTKLDSNTEPKAIHEVIGNKIVKTGVALTKETAVSLFIALYEQLKTDKLIETDLVNCKILNEK